MEDHGVDQVCVMTPHVVSDVESVTDALTGEMPDEVTRQGYHRQIGYIQCQCGERFTNRPDYEAHVEG